MTMKNSNRSAVNYLLTSMQVLDGFSVVFIYIYEIKQFFKNFFQDIFWHLWFDWFYDYISAWPPVLCQRRGCVNNGNCQAVKVLSDV